jgi:hypothetical protein
VENAVYNAVTDSWMIPQAQTPLQSPVTRVGESDSVPTHYALKIYPRTEEEQWEIETMDDISVSYIPFGYTQLTQQEVEKVESTKTRSAANISPFEVSPYTVTYENYESTDGGSTDPVTLQLPILYVIWPVEKPLPADLEYVVDHDVYMPSFTTVIKAAATSREPYPVYITVDDQTLGIDVPLANIPVTIRTNDYYYDPWDDRDRPGYWTSGYLTGITDDDGMIDIAPIIADYPSLFPNDIYCHLYIDVHYRDPNGKWRITSENSTATVSQTNSKLCHFTWMGAQDSDGYMPSDNRQTHEIHRAANYFFNTQTDFPKYAINGGIRIIASGTPNSYEGVTYWYNNYTNPPWIEIYNNNSTSSEVVGTTLHELGHFTHYWNGHSGSNANNYQNTLKGLKESFAPYVAWSLGERYYASLGWIRPSVSSYFPYGDITGDSRQGWVETLRLGQLGEYTPLFVDLADNYNQTTYWSSATPNDAIDGVPASVIWNVISTSRTWDQCRDKLEEYIGTGVGKYYTATEFQTWIEDFEFWFTRSYNQGL